MIYGEGLAELATEEWKATKAGVLSQLPFGAAGYARLDEQLKDSALWNEAPKSEGLDPMGLSPKQPNIELFNLEYYFGAPVNSPGAGKYTATIGSLLFGQRSRGSVKLQSKDPLDKPIVNHNYLADPLDLLVLSETCKFVNDIVTTGSGTKDLIMGPWPPTDSHHLNKTREDWPEYVKNNLTTCKCSKFMKRERT